MQERLLVGSWPAGWDVSQQPFCEALGGALAFEAALQVADLSGFVCILRNDAITAIAAFRKGSAQSAPVQRRSTCHVAPLLLMWTCYLGTCRVCN